MRAAPLLALALVLAGCTGVGPGDEPARPRAAPEPGPGVLDPSYLEGDRLPAEPVPYGDIVDRALALKGSPRATVLVEGQSGAGQPILGVLLAQGEASGKPTVSFTGSQHGNEPSGTDAAILLAEYLAWGGDEAQAVLEDVNVYILVCANPDGRALDQRGNADEVDVNRDHMDLATGEARLLHAVYHRVDPVAIVDLHQFGSPLVDPPASPASSAVVFEVASVQNPLAHPGIVAASHELEAAVVQAVQGAFGASAASTYPPTDSSQDSSIHRNHYGMHNSLSLLFEARRGLPEYATEVRLHLVGAQAVLAAIAGDPQGAAAAKAEAENEGPSSLGPVDAYLAPPQEGLDALVALLRAHGLNATLSVDAVAGPAVHYGAGAAEPVRAAFPNGTLVVPTGQADWRTASEMFESSSAKDGHYTAGPRDAGLDVWRRLSP